MNGRRLGVAAVLLSAISFTSAASADETQCAIDVMDGLDHVKAGRLVEADDAMRSAAPSCVPAREHAADLAWRIPRVFLHVSGRAREDLTLRLDGAVFATSVLDTAQRMNPGEHVFVAHTSDGAERHVTFVLVEGETKSVTIDFEAGRIVTVTAPETRTRAAISPIAWGGFGVAAIGLAVGTGTALVSIGKVRDVQERCADARCPTSERENIEDAKTYSTISTVAFVSAAVGAGVGILGLTLWKDTPKRETSARVSVGPGSVGVAGTF